MVGTNNSTLFKEETIYKDETRIDFQAADGIIEGNKIPDSNEIKMTNINKSEIKEPQIVFNSNSDYLNSIKNKGYSRKRKSSPSSAYLHYKSRPLLDKIKENLNNLEENIHNKIEASMFISLINESLENIWEYHPEADVNFAKVLTLIEDSISNKRWKEFSVNQFQGLRDIVDICMKDNISYNDQRKAYRILQFAGIDTFPEIMDISDER